MNVLRPGHSSGGSTNHHRLSSLSKRMSPSLKRRLIPPLQVIHVSVSNSADSIATIPYDTTLPYLAVEGVS